MEQLGFPRIFVKTPTVLNQPIPKLSLKRKNGDNFEVQQVESDSSDDDLPLISILYPIVQTEPRSSTVTCGRCHKKLEEESWPSHLKLHYGVAWRLNHAEDRPIDLTDCQLVVDTMNQFKAVHTNKGFACPHCTVLRHSALDALVHAEQCGGNGGDSTKCPNCDRSYLPYALYKHLQKGACKTNTDGKDVRSTMLAKMKAYMAEIADGATTSPPGTSYMCGKCTDAIYATDWPAHYDGHRGLTWRVGVDPSVDLQNRMTRILIVGCFREAHNLDTLSCEHCHIQRALPKGYIQHLDACEVRLATVMQNGFPTPEQSVEEREEGEFEQLTIKSEVVEEDYSFMEQTELVVAPPQMITCGNCHQQCPKKEWTTHMKFHNGLAWREGVDKPINTNDRSEVLAAMRVFTKKYQIESFPCEQCGTVRKSPAGLFSHMEKCGKDIKPVVRLCGKDIQPVAAMQPVRCPDCDKQLTTMASVQRHKHDCVVLRRRKTKSDERQATGWSEQSVNLAIHVREATVSMERLQVWRRDIRGKGKAMCQHGQYCAFAGVTLLEMTNHIPECPVHRRNLHSCKLCPFRSESYAVMYLHVTKKHKIDELSQDVKQNFDNYIYEDIKPEPDLHPQTPSFTDQKWVESMIQTRKSSIVGKELKAVWQSQKTLNHGLFSCLSHPKCTFQTEKRVQMTAHQRDCEVTPKMVHYCAGCNYYSFDEKVIAEHVNQHKAENAGGLNKGMVEVKGKDLELQKTILTPLAQIWKSSGNFQEIAKDWMLDLCSKNQATNAVFPNYKCDDTMVSFLSAKELSVAKPSITTSMRFAHALHEKYSIYSSSFDLTDWTRLDLMESCVHEGSSILFCGGPVVSLAWATFPPNYKGAEVLAVCCKNHPDDFYKMPDLKKPKKCLIQLWMFEQLNNNADVSKATLKYAIACDNGPMRYMQFCPSGGYSCSDDRLGLLAAATVNGISIYALPLHVDIKVGQSPIIRLLPVQVLNMEGCPATCIDWAISNQSRIAGGFDNGVMAVWDLDVQTKLLQYEENGVPVLNPVKLVKAAQSAVTTVKFHASGDTCFLLVTSLDRRVKVYDLDTSFMPMEISSFQAKSRVLSADWSPHWTAFCIGLDECLSLERCGIYLKHPHDIGERNELVMTAEASSLDMDFNRWTNECISVTEAGDICAVKSMQMLVNVTTKKIWNSRLVFGYTDVVNLSGSQVAHHLNEDYTYNDDNGIVFCDLDLAKNHSMSSLGMKTLRSRTLIGYPFGQINRVRFNQNQQAHKFYAIGYQAGFVRVKKLQAEGIKTKRDED